MFKNTMTRMRSNLALWLMLIAAFAAFTTLTGCNTMEGVGEDTQEAGDAIDDAAEDAQD